MVSPRPHHAQRKGTHRPHARPTHISHISKRVLRDSNSLGQAGSVLPLSPVVSCAGCHPQRRVAGKLRCGLLSCPCPRASAPTVSVERTREVRGHNSWLWDCASPSAAQWGTGLEHRSPSGDAPAATPSNAAAVPSQPSAAGGEKASRLLLRARPSACSGCPGKPILGFCRSKPRGGEQDLPCSPGVPSSAIVGCHSLCGAIFKANIVASLSPSLRQRCPCPGSWCVLCWLGHSGW